MKRNGMKKLTAWILTVALCLAVCATALGATGDRTLVHVKSDDGGMNTYIQNVFMTDKGITAYLNGQSQRLVVYSESGEPVEYALEDSAESTSTELEDGGFAYTQTVGWFDWKGELYTLQYNNIQRGESSEIEGGFVKKAKLEDGKILLEDCDIPQLDFTYMIEDYGGWQGVKYLNKIVVCGDSLYAATWDNNGNSVLEAFDLTRGFASEIPMQDMESIYPGPEGSLLTLRFEWGEEVRMHVIRLEPESQSEEELGVVSFKEGQIQGMCYDEKTNTLYYMLNGEIWAAKDMNLEAAEAVSDCPIPYDVNSFMLEDGRILLWNNTAIVLRNPDPAAKGESFELVIRDYNYGDSMSDTIYDFTDARSDATVVLKRGGDASTILQAMMNRDAETDIFTLNYQSSEFEALRNRGFLADLSGNADLSAAADRMLPFIQDAIRQDGKLVAVPATVSGNMIGYMPETLKKAGLTEADLPKSWPAFFDWMEKLPELLAGKDISVFDPWQDRQNFRQNLLNMLLNQYQAYLNTGAQEYAFNTPMLRELLERLDRLDYDALGLKEPEYDEEGGGMSYSEYTEPLLQTYTQTTIETWQGGSQPLVLALAEDMDPILPVTLTVAFVNPYSEHADAAAEFLALSLKNLRTATQYSIYTDKKEPIRDPYYEENVKGNQKWLEEARANLEKADEENKPMWEEMIADYEENIRNLEENSWMISGKAIEAYAQRTPWLKVLTYDFANALMSTENSGSDYWTMMWNYAAGTVGPEELLSGIDKKVQMMRLEGN